jgi:hypothetical protein
MATLRINTDLEPRWISQNGCWLENTSLNSPYRPASNESMNGDSNFGNLETNVLVNILSVLKRMDSKMELQTKRLEIVEVTGSPGSGSSSDSTSLSEPPLFRGQGSGRTTIVSEPGDNEESKEYLHSISGLKHHFLHKAPSFVDMEDLKDLVIPEEPDSPNFRPTGNWADLVHPGMPEADAYSVSMYSGDLLGGSKMSLGLYNHAEQDPTPTSPSQRNISPSFSELEGEDASNKQIAATGQIEKCQTIREESPAPSIEEGNATDSPQRHARHKRISISVSEPKANSRYIKIEFGLYAFDTWKQGVLSKIKNDSRVFWEQEKTRLSGLRQTTYQATGQVSRGLGRMKSALEREWVQEKERLKSLRQTGAKRGVKIFNWRVSISFRDVVHVNRDESRSEIA